jgi:MFS family permease
VRPRSRYGALYRKLYVAAVGTRFGDATRTSAVAVLAATLTQRPLLVALVTAMAFLPWLVFGLPAGALIDRVDKRRAFLRADAFRCVVAGLTGVLAFTGQLSIYLLIVVAFALTTAQTISDSCFNSLLPAAVPTAELGSANARLSVGQSTANLVGNPAGGFLVTTGAAFPFLVNVLTFGLAAGLVSSMRKDVDRTPRPASGKPTPRALLRDVAAGFTAIRHDRTMLSYLFTVSTSNFCNGLNIAVLPLLALDEIHLPHAAYGLLMATSALTMIVGNLAAPRLVRRRNGRTAALITLLPKVPGFLLLTTAHGVAQLFVAVALLGTSSGLWNVQQSAYVMRAAPAEYIGRIVALNRTVATAGMPLGAACAGVVATVLGVRSAPALAAIISAAVIALWTAHVVTAPAGENEEGDDLSLACSQR